MFGTSSLCFDSQRKHFSGQDQRSRRYHEHHFLKNQSRCFDFSAGEDAKESDAGKQLDGKLKQLI